MKKPGMMRRLLFSSCAVLLYMTMFFGATLAWYADSGVLLNTFTFGELSVELGKTDGGVYTRSKDGLNLGFLDSRGNVITGVLTVEPGVTFQLQPIYVDNVGTVPLNYRFSLKYSKSGEETDLFDAMEFSVKAENEPVQPLSAYVSRLEAGVKSEPIVIYMHMKETAGNEYQKLELNDLTVTVFAYQDGMSDSEISEVWANLKK